MQCTTLRRAKSLAEARGSALQAERSCQRLTVRWSRHAASGRGAASDGPRATQLRDPEAQKLSEEFRKIGRFLDKATADLRRGLIALKKNSHVVGRDFRHVQTLHRVLQVAFFDTLFRDAFGVPDATDAHLLDFQRRLERWCRRQDASLRHELEALDGTSRKRRRRMSIDWRDWEMIPKPQSDFAKIFGAPREYQFVRKATYRGGSGRRLHHIENLTREEAKHLLAHDPHGRAFARERGEPLDVLADHLVEASLRPTEKREATMDSTTRMLKNVRSMGEHEYTRIVGDYAKRLYPELTRERAFVKVFTSDDAEGRAIRHFWQISKQAPLDDEPVDDADEEDEDALAELETLAAEVRRRCPTLTKAQAFTKAYTDPANAKLAARERAQHRPK